MLGRQTSIKRLRTAQPGDLIIIFLPFSRMHAIHVHAKKLAKLLLFFELTKYFCIFLYFFFENLCIL